MKRTNIPAHPNNYYVGRQGVRPRLIVVHSGETGEGDTAAEGMGSWFANPSSRASTHKGVDPDSVCTYLSDLNTPFGAAGANRDGLHLELAGRAGQTRGQWSDAASQLILANGAQVCAEWAVLWGIPPRWLTDAQLADGRSRGFTTHAQVSRVFKRGDHWDPGPNFPALAFMVRVVRAYDLITTPTTPKEPEMKFTDPVPGMTDPDGSPVTVAEALIRGAWMYANRQNVTAEGRAAWDSVTEGGVTDRRLDRLEAAPKPTPPAAAPEAAPIKGKGGGSK